MTGADALLQEDALREIDRIGSEQWTNVCLFEHTSRGKAYWCAFLKRSVVERALTSDDWDLRVGDHLPGFSQRHVGKKKVTEYYRFGCDDGIVPLVFLREYHGLRPAHFEVLEEFRHFHNLYEDHPNGRLNRYDDDGNEEVVVEITEHVVRIRTSALMQFMAAKQLDLAIYFDHRVFEPIGAAERTPSDVVFDPPGSRIRRVVAKMDDEWISRLTGKKILSAPPQAKCGRWPFEEKSREFATFVIGVDPKTGDRIEHTCDPETLANYFGKNEGAPHFLTPVAFRREVLKRYYDDSGKYTVEDGCVRCAGLWLLKIDNDHADKVTVFLGDLGEALGHAEQLHWKAHNIAPDSDMVSATNLKRSFAAEFADATAHELRFKQALVLFHERWEKAFGWHLLRPLIAEDAHVFKGLHLPTTKSIAEFEDQLLRMTKLLVDSLNDAGIIKEIGPGPQDEKSIAKLARYLQTKSYPHEARDVAFLRKLQEARSQGAAHRKGSSYAKLQKSLGLDSSSPQEVFTKLLDAALAMLADLTAHFIDSGKAGSS